MTISDARCDVFMSISGVVVVKSDSHFYTYAFEKIVKSVLLHFNI